MTRDTDDTDEIDRRTFLKNLGTGAGVFGIIHALLRCTDEAAKDEETE